MIFFFTKFLFSFYIEFKFPCKQVYKFFFKYFIYVFITLLNSVQNFISTFFILNFCFTYFLFFFFYYFFNGFEFGRVTGVSIYDLRFNEPRKKVKNWRGEKKKAKRTRRVNKGLGKKEIMMAKNELKTSAHMHTLYTYRLGQVGPSHMCLFTRIYTYTYIY